MQCKCGAATETRSQKVEGEAVEYTHCPACKRNSEIFRHWMQPFINQPEPEPPKVVESLPGQLGLDLGVK